MKTIDDLLNNLPKDDVPGKDGTTFQIEMPQEFKEYMKHESTIEMMKHYQYSYMETMHKLQVEMAKTLGISKTREGEIKKM